MYKKWVEVEDSKGNKVLINPKIVYRYKEFNDSFLFENKLSA